MPQINQTTRQDLPDWARPLGWLQENLLLQYLFGGGWKPNTDGSHGPGDIYYEPDRMPDYETMGGPLREEIKFNPLQLFGQVGALKQANVNKDIVNQNNQWILDSLSRGDPSKADTAQDFARQQQTFNLMGPIAGATRNGLLEGLNGDVYNASTQKYLDQLYGKSANSAERSAYNTLGGQRDLATDASLASFAGPLAGAARSQAMRTINGDYLGPNSNPYLRSNLDAASKAVADNYKYATAPSTNAQFARAGSFGGSAHQQTKDMQQFELGRNLSDLANQFYGGQYAQERQNQLGAINSQQQFAQQAQEAERTRQYGTQENTLNRAAQTAQDAMAGWRQLLDQQAGRAYTGSEAELQRSLALQQLLPQLMQSQYLPYDIERTIGGEYQNLTNANNDIRYQNQYQKFQWPFNVLQIMGGNLGSATGGQSVTSQSSSNPNQLSGAAQGLGYGLAGGQILSALTPLLFGGGNQTTQTQQSPG